VLEHCHEYMHEAIEKLEKSLRNSVLDEQVDSLKSMDLSIEKLCETSLIRVNHSRFTSLVSSDDGILLKYPGNEIQLHSGFIDLVLAIVGRSNNAFTLHSLLKRPLSPEEEKFIRFLVKDGFLVALG